MGVTLRRGAYESCRCKRALLSPGQQAVFEKTDSIFTGKEGRYGNLYRLAFGRIPVRWRVSGKGGA